MKTKTKEQRQEYKADYRVVWLSALGLLGFIIGFLIGSDIFDGPKNDTVFSEIEYRPQVIFESLVRKPADSLKTMISHRGVRLGLRDDTVVNANSSNSRTEMEKREALIKEKEKQGTQNKDIKKEETDSLALLKQQHQIDIATYKTLVGYTIYSGLDKGGATGFDKLNKAMRFTINMVF